MIMRSSRPVGTSRAPRQVTQRVENLTVERIDLPAPQEEELTQHAPAPILQTGGAVSFPASDVSMPTLQPVSSIPVPEASLPQATTQEPWREFVPAPPELKPEVKQEAPEEPRIPLMLATASIIQTILDWKKTPQVPEKPEQERVEKAVQTEPLTPAAPTVTDVPRVSQAAEQVAHTLLNATRDARGDSEPLPPLLTSIAVVANSLIELIETSANEPLPPLMLLAAQLVSVLTASVDKEEVNEETLKSAALGCFILSDTDEASAVLEGSKKVVRKRKCSKKDEPVSFSAKKPKVEVEQNECESAGFTITISFRPS